MNGILSAITIGLSLFLLSVPLFNRYVFHTINVDAIRTSGSEGLEKVQGLLKEQRFELVRDSAEMLIDRYCSDSLTFFQSDVVDWVAVRAMLLGKQANVWSSLIRDNFTEEEIKDLESAPEPEVPGIMRRRFVEYVNFYAEKDPQFFIKHQDSLDVDRIPELAARLKILIAKGLISGIKGDYVLKEKLTPAERNQIQRFHVMIFQDLLFPNLIRKDLRRGKDWASEFIVQSAMFYIGASYHAQQNLDDAIRTWNDLIALYPSTIYAEHLFLQIGGALYQDGLKLLGENQPAAAANRFQEGISYLERIERNREVSRQFPKYKYADLTPDVFVNADAAARAKSKTKIKTTLYTSEQAAAELSGKKSDDRSGYVLEDAVKQIGQIYIALGKTDSARMQFSLLLVFFPESDNLAEAQKLIAESWVKEGDLTIARADTSNKEAVLSARSKAESVYTQAIKEFQKFINIYPQSDLIAKVYIAIADVYFKLERPKEGAAAFASALGRAKEAEEQAKVQLQIGSYYFERKQYKQAADAFRIILNSFLSTQVAPNAQYFLGESYERLGDTTQALAAYTVILDQYKSSSLVGQAAWKLGNSYFDKGNYKEAISAYDLGYTYDPDGNLAAKTKLQVGMIWKKIADSDTGTQKKADLGEAIKQFKQVVDKFKGKSEAADQASYQMAECYLAMNNEKAAREAVKQIDNREIAVKSITLFGIGGAEGNAQEEADYWAKAFTEAQEDEERSSALYEQGLVVADKLGKPTEAIDLFTRSADLTKKISKKINDWIGIARAYNTLRRFSEAESLYVQLIGTAKVSEELRQQMQIQLYDCQFKNKKLDEAREGFENFVAQHPQHALTPYGLYRIGMILVDQKHSAEAVERFQTVLDKYPKSDMVDNATLGIGEQMIAQGKFAEAEKYLLSFLAIHPQSPVAVNMLMKIAEVQSKNLDKKKEAIQAYTRILTEFPGDDNSYFSYAAYLLGTMFKEAGEDKNAIDVLLRVRKKEKSVYRAAQAEAGKLIAKTDPQRAIGNYQQIVNEAETPEDSAIAIIGIGDVYTSIKDWTSAAEKFSLVHQFYHGADTALKTGALVKWADALLNNKKYNDVIKVSGIMQSEFPDHIQTIYTIYFESSALFALEKYAQFRDVLDKIIKMNKMEQLTEIAYYQKGDSYYFTKDYKSAISMYQQYIDKYPKGKFVPRALNMQGNCYVSMEEFAKSKDKFAQVVNSYPDFEEICVAKNYLAYSLNRLDEWRSAMKYYEQVIKSGGCTGKAQAFAREQYEGIKTSH